MAILGSKNRFIEDYLEEKRTYTIPAMIRNSDDEKEMSLKKSVILSAILHPTLAGAICLVVFVLALMGVTFSIFDKPKPKMNDLEFILIDKAKTQTPLNKNTLNRSRQNTRTGGNHNKKREVSEFSASPAKKSVQQKQSSGSKITKKTAQKKVTTQGHPKNIFKSLMQPKAAPQAKPQPHPTRPQLRPSLKPPSTPRPTIKPSSPFAVPVPKTTAPGRSYSTGPIGGHGTATSSGISGSGRNSRGGNYAPVPSLAPTGGSGNSSGSRMSRGGSGYGQSGNPGGGGGTTGIDSIGEFDMTPYIRELQRRIKMNWDPPKGNENKSVVILFRIGRNGQLISRSVRISSGIPSFDKAALNAVELTAPFRPLPAGYKHPDAPVDFRFDYNTISGSGH